MKKKFEFDNVFSLNVFDDIKGEIKVKYPDVKFFINKEKQWKKKNEKKYRTLCN